MRRRLLFQWRFQIKSIFWPGGLAALSDSLEEFPGLLAAR